MNVSDLHGLTSQREYPVGHIGIYFALFNQYIYWLYFCRFS